MLDELKSLRTTLDRVNQLNEELRQAYALENPTRDDLQPPSSTLEYTRQLNALDELLAQRRRQLNLACEQRRTWNDMMEKLHEWLTSTEQQIKDPLATHLQSTTDVLNDQSQRVQVKDSVTVDSHTFFFSLFCTRPMLV